MDDLIAALQTLGLTATHKGGILSIGRIQFVVRPRMYSWIVDGRHVRPMRGPATIAQWYHLRLFIENTLDQVRRLGVEAEYRDGRIRLGNGIEFAVRLLARRVELDRTARFNLRQGREFLQHILQHLQVKADRQRNAILLRDALDTLRSVGIVARLEDESIRLTVSAEYGELLSLLLLYAQAKNSFIDKAALLDAVLSGQAPAEAYCDWLEENGHGSADLRRLL